MAIEREAAPRGCRPASSTLAEPDVALEQRELLVEIAALPAELRVALVPVDVLGLSYREAASALDRGSPPSTSSPTGPPPSDEPLHPRGRVNR